MTGENKPGGAVPNNKNVDSGIRSLWPKFVNSPLLLKLLLGLCLAAGIAIAISVPVIIIKMNKNQADEQPDTIIIKMNKNQADEQPDTPQPVKDPSENIKRFNTALSNRVDLTSLIFLYNEIKSECDSIHGNNDCLTFFTVSNTKMKKYIDELVREAASKPLEEDRKIIVEMINTLIGLNLTSSWFQGNTAMDLIQERIVLDRAKEEKDFKKTQPASDSFVPKGEPIDEDQIDESLYSRQLYVLGHEAMRRMQKANVLIIGLRGLGVELAKDVILAGVKSVTLWDNQSVQISDLGSQFFLLESDIGKPRAKSCMSKLAELNDYVQVQLLDEPLDAMSDANLTELIKNFQVIALCDPHSLEFELKLNSICHSNGIAFISASTRGLTGKVFCDFGESFVVIDDNGEPAITGLIGGIVSEGNRWIITSLEESRHGLEDGHVVCLKDVFTKPVSREIRVQSSQIFSIPLSKEDELDMKSVITLRGSFEQVKQPLVMTFKPLKEAINCPLIVPSDFGKFDHQPVLHHLYYHPFATAPEHNELQSKLHKASRGYIAPLASIIGSIAAQEVLKACTGKFKPIHQFFYFDAVEALPTEPSSDHSLLGSRYDEQISLFGQAFQSKLSKLKGFVVGSGAIGCELLKIFSLMGIGNLVVTDMDNIERSNLNRQFLFRPKDVGQPKSKISAEFIHKHVNPEIKIEARTDRVGPETENIFDDEFFEGLDFVANALDNVSARRYMDRRCVLFEKPLLESGTLGAKGNTQIIIPHLTESYSSSQDPPEHSIPYCTLHSFPNAIEHCIEWAMDLFKGTFTDKIILVNGYLSGENITPASKFATFYLLIADNPKSFEDCLTWGRKEFQARFHNAILQLLCDFPPDKVTSSGAPFWSGPKRPPTPIIFDATNPMHFAFVKGIAMFKAQNFNFKPDENLSSDNQISSFLSHLSVPEFSPREREVTPSEIDECAAPPDELSSYILDEYEESLLADEISPRTRTQLQAVEFEKDDDSNGQVDFLTCASNLRALNYGIQPSDRYSVKGIAGKIIPAIATTTALVSGLIALELYKIVSNGGDISKYRNGFINLALPFFGFTEPVAPPVTKYREFVWTLWDRFKLDGTKMTLREMLDWFQKEYKLEVSMLSSDSSILYTPALTKSINLDSLLVDLLKKPLPLHAKSVVIEVLAEDDQGNDFVMPFIWLKIR